MIKLQPVVAFCRKIFVVLNRSVPAQLHATEAVARGKRQDLTPTRLRADLAEEQIIQSNPQRGGGTMSNGMRSCAQGARGNDQFVTPSEKNNKWSLTPFVLLPLLPFSLRHLPSAASSRVSYFKNSMVRSLPPGAFKEFWVICVWGFLAIPSISSAGWLFKVANAVFQDPEQLVSNDRYFIETRACILRMGTPSAYVSARPTEDFVRSLLAQSNPQVGSGGAYTFNCWAPGVGPSAGYGGLYWAGASLNYATCPSPNSSDPACVPPPKNYGPPLCSQGNPVNVGTGIKFQPESDYLDQKLGLRRYFNGSIGVQHENLGMRWRGSYDRSLISSTSFPTSSAIYRPDGKAYTFTLVSGAWFP
ncbi:MAG: DUF6531 domain-containing protein, partial [Pseudomonadota bacterium]